MGAQRRADPGQRLVGGVARRLVVRIEDRNEARDAVVRHAAASAADGDGGQVAAAGDGAGQGRHEVLPDLNGSLDERSFGVRPTGTDGRVAAGGL